jgi:serine/threonine protein kinase
MKKWHDDWEKFNSFKNSNETGQIFKLRERISKKIRELVESLAVYLKSDEAKKVALKWKREDLGDDEQKLFDEKQVQDLVQERFTKTITQSKQFLDFTRWASGRVMEEVQSVVKDLKVLEAEVTNVSPAGDPGDLLRKFGQEIGHFGGMQKLAATALTVAMVLVAPVVLALGTLQITLMPLYKLADFISSMGEKRFRKALERGYNETVEKSCENDCKILFATLKEILQTAVEPVKVAFKTIPARIEDLKHRLESRANHEAADIPMFEAALVEVSQVNGCLSKFELEMNIHEFSDNDIEWPNPRTPQSIGSYGSVFEVSLPGKKKAMLKVLQDPVTEENAGDRFRKLLVFRKFLNPKNMVSFRGSVVVSHSPLLLGFLFEDYGRLTLADLIFGEDWVLPSTTGGGFMEAKEITLQILDGLYFLHENAIVHGHLSPDTILLTKMTGGKVKLSEPLTSQPVVDKQTDLTPYLAPEVLSKLVIRQSSDVYSVGIVLWEMLTGKRAYMQVDLKAMDIAEFTRQVTNEELHPGMPLSAKGKMDALQGGVAASWHALARKCWSVIERDRPSLDEVKQAVTAMTDHSRRRLPTHEEVSKKKPSPMLWRHTVTGQPSRSDSPSEQFKRYSEQMQSTEEIDEHFLLEKSGSNTAKMEFGVIKSLHGQVSADKIINSDLKSQLSEQELVITHLQKQLEHTKQDLEATKVTNEEKLKKCEGGKGIVHIPEESLNISDTSIGLGKLGEVRVAYWKGASVAVKILNLGDLTDQNRKVFAEELAIASHIHHPNIATIFGVVTSNALPTHIVMELLEGSVSDLITGARLNGPYLTLREQVDLATDVVCGLTYLHDLKPKAVVHGDLRPANVLINSMMVAKISGIGTWRVLGSCLPPGPYTFSYLPPEKLPSQSSVVPRATTGADLYGLGVTLLEVFSGQPASRREREIQLMEVSVDKLRQLCVFLTEDNPQGRMSLRDTRTILKEVRDDSKYQQCPNKRLVKGRSHGSSFITLFDTSW